MSKRVALLLAALAGAGCGATSHGFRAAAPVTVRLGWHGSAPGGMSFSVRSLTVRADGWSVAASVRNDSRESLEIGRIHRPFPQTTFGIAEVVGNQRARPPQRYATRFVPPLPRTLSPGASWRGVFSGSAALPAGHRFRVVMGTFFASLPIVLEGRRFSRFNIYTDQSVLLP